MNDKISDLWPADFSATSILTPVAILRQQGATLGQKTQNIVFGRVITQSNDGGFRQIFYLTCPPLGYQVELLFADHGIDLYPATIHVSGEAGPPKVAADADAFATILKEVFASGRTKKIVGSLLAQSKE